MPEYLAPGVFVEEVSYRAKSIEGVSTTTTGFIGPDALRPALRGAGADHRHGRLRAGVRRRRPAGLRRRQPSRSTTTCGTPPGRSSRTAASGCMCSGSSRRPKRHARRSRPLGGRRLTIESRFPGAASTRRVRMSLELGPNVLSALPELDRSMLQVPRRSAHRPEGSPPEGPDQPGIAVLHTLADRDVVMITRRSAGGVAGFFLAPRAGDERRPHLDVPGRHDHAACRPRGLSRPTPTAPTRCRSSTATVTVYPDDPDTGLPQVWGRLPLDPDHVSFGAQRLAHPPVRRASRRTWTGGAPCRSSVGECRDGSGRRPAGFAGARACSASPGPAPAARRVRRCAGGPARRRRRAVLRRLPGRRATTATGPARPPTRASSRPRRQVRAQAVRGPRGHLDRRRARARPRAWRTRSSAAESLDDHPVA